MSRCTGDEHGVIGEGADSRRDDHGDLAPLYVFLHVGANGKLGLYSRNNRRLLALLMFQATRRDSLPSASAELSAACTRSPISACADHEL